jgi:threonine/homoserine/homoserine lactone efflux protein
MLPLFLVLGTVFGALGAAGAYAISYSEYRHRRLRPDQSARRMALETAAVTFVVFFLAAIVLSFLL